MDMDRFQAHRRQFARATVAKSVLDYIAIIFLAASFAFWSVLYWQLFRPASIVSLGTVTVIVLALVYSLAAPLLLSMLVPTTPAGQLLQKTQWATVGFPVIIASSLYLVYQGFTMIDMWLQAQGGIDPGSGLPVIAAAGQNTRMALSLIIAFVIIPALAWVQTTPERWLAAIQQAHAVKKLEMQQRGELAIIKASMLRAERLAIKGWANLLPLERDEAFSTMRGLLMASSDTQRDIVRTLNMSSELERDIIGDVEIADRLAYVAQEVDVLPDIAPARGQIDAPSPSEPAKAAPVPYTKPHTDAVMARVALTHRNAARDESYTLAYDQLSGGAWTVRELAELLDVAESTARDIRIKWTAAELVSGQGLPNGRYRFTS